MMLIAFDSVHTNRSGSNFVHCFALLKGQWFFCRYITVSTNGSSCVIEVENYSYEMPACSSFMFHRGTLFTLLYSYLASQSIIYHYLRSRVHNIY